LRHAGEDGPPPTRDRRDRLFVLDFDLVGFSGHCFNQVFGFRAAARALGLEPRVLIPAAAEASIAGLLDARALLPPVPWHLADQKSAGEILAWTRAALRPVWDSIVAEQVAASDILLITSSRPAVICALADWLDTLQPEACPAVFFRFFGAEFLNFENTAFTEYSWPYRHASNELASRPGQERVFFTVNNRKIIAKLEQLVSRPVHLMPMPKYYGDAAPAGRSGEDRQPTVYVHVNRQGEMPQRVAAAIATVLQQDATVKFLVRFCRHAHADDTASRASFSGLAGPSVELLAAEDDHRSYLATIARSDVVLLPYDPIEYRGIQSGPFCEAAALGKVVVAPAETWMADNIADGHAVGVLFAQPSAAELATATAAALRDLPRLQAQAARRAEPFRAENSCQRNVERMMELAGLPRSRLPSRIKVWDRLRGSLRGVWPLAGRR
jgi:glycosyltransferase involved in cell wall biosynthesis